jgi:hypothetical protein
MIVNVDFSKTDDVNVEFMSTPYLPEGQYECKCKKAFWKKSRNGTLYMCLIWEAIDGEFAGYQAVERKYFTQKTKPYLVGWARNLNVVLDSKYVNENVFVGRYALVSISRNSPDSQKQWEIVSASSRKYANKNILVSASDGAEHITEDDIAIDSDGADHNAVDVIEEEDYVGGIIHTNIYNPHDVPF